MCLFLSLLLVILSVVKTRLSLLSNAKARKGLDSRRLNFNSQGNSQNKPGEWWELIQSTNWLECSRWKTLKNTNTYTHTLIHTHSDCFINWTHCDWRWRSTSTSTRSAVVTIKTQQDQSSSQDNKLCVCPLLTTFSPLTFTWIYFLSLFACVLLGPSTLISRVVHSIYFLSSPHKTHTYTWWWRQVPSRCKYFITLNSWSCFA